MVNKRAKIKKTRINPKTSFSKAPTAESTESGALVGSNDDLLTEILHRLPVTSILRFKSVSKHWQSLLSHKRFTLPYDSVPVSPGLFVHDLYIPFDVENQTPPPFRSLNFCSDRRGIRIVQSCNGLLLCCSNRGREHTRKYYVFNPTTKQFAAIPPVIGGSNASNPICFMVLAFHPTNCVNYKVVCFRNVCFVNRRYTNLFQIQIYSSDTGDWRISPESLSLYDFYSFTNRVYYNGAIHWIPNCFEMAYFNLEADHMQKMLLPERVTSSREERPPGERPLYIGESRGYVHLVESARQERRSLLLLNVYEMLSDYSGWSIKYRVELDELPKAYPDMIFSNQDPSRYVLEVIDVVRGEEEESTFMVVRFNEKVITYNVVNKCFKKIFDMPHLLCSRGMRYTYFHRYTQILSSF